MVELKNDLSIRGILHSADQYLNIKLTDVSVTDPEKYPQRVSEDWHKSRHFCELFQALIYLEYMQ